MSFPEPSNLPIVLTSWVLDHAPGARGRHTVGNLCSYIPTHECSFAVSHSSSLNGQFQSVQILQGPPVSSQPLAPLSVAIVPFSRLPLFIRVDATPSRHLTIHSADLRT